MVESARAAGRQIARALDLIERNAGLTAAARAV